MQPKQEKGSVDVVSLDSSDEEDGATVARKEISSLGKHPLRSAHEIQVAPESVPSSESVYRPLDSRSFWKAGEYEVAPSRLIPAQGQVEHARVHPKFLHSNATSHKWAFGAIAELLDNSVDEICNGATFVKVDRIYNGRDNSPALLFLDDGGGMDPEGIRKCMSLGYSSKKSNTTIGQYGNGFKTSTMRLGADAVVFSRASNKGRATQSVGLLSYTFLRTTGQDDVIVPMVDFDTSDHWADPIIYSSHGDWSTNMKTILEWSPFASKDVLMQQFEDIGSHGTKIIIYNLWLNDEGVFELNFDDDDEDIRLRDETSRSGLSSKKLEFQSHISYRFRFSLRAYASILYLRKFTNFRIILRGKTVEQFNIADDLRHRKAIKYRPQIGASKEVVVETTLGFIKEDPTHWIYGFNVYHKNRLIRPFWRVLPDGSFRGSGVVGVLEANFIEPAHDKQDFEKSSLFFRLETKLKQMITEYWKGHCHLMGYQAPVAAPRDTQKELLAAAAENMQKDSIQHPVKISVATGLAEGQSPASVNGSRSASSDQIREENIQLFMRCEKHMLKENELKRTIEELEKELEQTKAKCVQLSSHLEIQKQQILKGKPENV